MSKKVKVSPVQQLSAVEPVVVKTISQSHRIWADLKDKPLNVFGLKNKTVSDYCNMVEIDPNKCYLVSKATAVLSILEENFGYAYDFSQAEKYIIVEKK